MEYTQWWGPHVHWFWILLLLFMVLMFVCAASRIRRCGSGLRAPFGCCTPRRGPTARRRAETPRQILDRRYASGEITNEEYERIKRDIGSSSYENARSDPS